MAEPRRDLMYSDPWEASLERSLQRRRRPRTTSVELWRLRPARDLSDAGLLIDSLTRSKAKRAAAARSGPISAPTARGMALVGLAAVAAAPVGDAFAASSTATLSGSPTRVARVVAVSTTALPAPSSSVATVQRALGVSADGLFGPQTETAVRSFQAAHGLTVDGIVGPQTRAALGIGAGPELQQVIGGSSGSSASGSSGTPTATAASLSPRAATTPSSATTPVSGVRAAQSALGIAADGLFGPQTEAAVKSFQAAHGLTVDGIVGPATRAALGIGSGPLLEQVIGVAGGAKHATGTGAQPTAKASSLSSGANGSSSSGGASGSHHSGSGGGVSALQRALGVPVDGNFGPQTEAAVKSFQAAHGLTVDGIVGDATRAALQMGSGPVLHERKADLASAAGSSSSSGSSNGSASASDAGASSGLPEGVLEMIAAGNQIATLPYIYGGGHGSFISDGYDCSGSVSYVLHAAGLLSSPEDSTGLESYGAPGPGRYVTIYANAGHAWMTIDGRRFDTIALQEYGSRWTDVPGDTDGYVVRHPIGY